MMVSAPRVALGCYTAKAARGTVRIMTVTQLFEGDAMANDNTKLHAKPTPIPAWSYPFAIATAIVFLLSSLFPVVAGLSKDTASFPAWWGMLDVGIAFILAI